MQIIVKCPECSAKILVKAGTDFHSELVYSDKKECVGCGAKLAVRLNIKAEKEEIKEKKEE